MTTIMLLFMATEVPTEPASISTEHSSACYNMYKKILSYNICFIQVTLLLLLLLMSVNELCDYKSNV